MRKFFKKHKIKIAVSSLSLGAGCYLWFLGRLITMEFGLMGANLLPGGNFALVVGLGIVPFIIGLGAYLISTERKLSGMEGQIEEMNVKELKETCDQIDTMGKDMVITCNNINSMGNDMLTTCADINKVGQDMITLATNIEYELQPIGEIADMASTLTTMFTKMPIANLVYRNLHRGVEYDRLQKERMPRYNIEQEARHGR